ncbi:hypothetical protein [Paenibacillus roseipurpureus]|uniref:Uncharacterized protein n=1 Tax=Paenibacillus roseopurpureus TaxID=2918901 RepID=A0AA96RL78_9BACL|nr:hypothetical protein [Paenibacillus sp. MBLB1832]WNR45109.1 hypothetical protein MJB10_02870 [Paenibacillus sp. MBLB1832]
MAEKRTGKSLQELIDHVYEQELAGNIQKLPATERTLLLHSNYDELPMDVAKDILEESKRVEEFKLMRLGGLRKLCDNPGYNEYIANILGVPYRALFE